MKNRVIFFTLLLFFMGCAQNSRVFIDENGNAYQYGNFNLIQKVQQATNLLISKSNLKPDNLIILTTIVDIDNFKKTSQLGRTISEEVAKTFIDKGIKVIDLRATNSVIIKQRNGSFYLTRDAKYLVKGAETNYIFFGTYSIGHTSVYLTFKLINPETHIVISAVNFQLPLNNDIRKMLGLKLLSPYYPPL